jgi:uncharacterized protein YqhQ
MSKKKKRCYSGIGGQAVLEGIMMKNEEKYAVAVRKPDGEIAMELDYFKGILGSSKIKKIPFIRGIFQFIDSMILGTRTLNYSASFYEEEEETALDKKLNKLTHGHGEKILSALILLLAVAFAMGLFIVLPYYITSLFSGHLLNRSLIAVVEGVVRIAIFVLYIVLISAMSDIRRLFQYHGAEHKCINCLERGRALTIPNIMRSSRFHRRCGTSFIFFVFLISIVLFFFIQVNNPFEKILYRIALMPIVAGISYEVIRLAGRYDILPVRILSMPGMWIQRLTTKEPTPEMVSVAIAAVEAVYDWKEFLCTNFGCEIEEIEQEVKEEQELTANMSMGTSANETVLDD